MSFSLEYPDDVVLSGLLSIEWTCPRCGSRVCSVIGQSTFTGSISCADLSCTLPGERLGYSFTYDFSVNAGSMLGTDDRPLHVT